MKTKLLFITILLLLTNCTTSKNTDEFIKTASGRYFFNADEIIEVKFNEGKLFIAWRNQDLEPLKINDSTFYARELNEKLIFNTEQNRIKLAKKREHEDNVYVFNKLKEGEKTPSEYLAENNFEAALNGYKSIRKKDSLNPVIRQRNLNRLGYRYLSKNDFEKAISIFKINIELYPKSSNTYDSTGDAYLKMKDTVKAIEYYKKSLAINPENRSSRRALKRITEKEDN
ncbi:tetratricopeptide repeat protein [uncultured Tenacibaculum sp.]|uniref:tetratricopeptide repeat protein n=1 Tax=uncultured Tenacibaculum sp. TaxID=174713 RepID=UPI00260A4D92|nr:tetratricopeptide repeat protein [uncultured Tenacibaculum sp.]